MSEIILVGGSKDGTIAEGDKDTKAINNIVLDDSNENPEFIDLYMPTNVTDKEGRAIYAHIGRYDATESASYWATLSAEEKQALKEAAEAAKEFVEEPAAEEVPETKDEPAEAVVETKEEVVRDGSEIDDPVETAVEETPAEEPAKPDEPAAENEETGDKAETPDEVVEVEEEKAE